jgi:hypothetical protein
MICRKLENIQTSTDIKLEILKLLRELLSSDLLLDIFCSLDCQYYRKNSI